MADFRQDKYNQCSNYQHRCGDFVKGKIYSYEITKIIPLCTSGSR